MKVAYVYPDFTALDLVGPYEVISRWPDVEVRFVAFDSGSPSNASRETRRLAERVLLAGQSRIKVMAQGARTIIRARRRKVAPRALVPLSERRPKVGEQQR